MGFQWPTLILIRKKHLNIDLYGINFSMEGHNVFNPNDGSIVVPADVVEAEDDKGDQKDDFVTFEDIEDTLGADHEPSPSS